MTVNLYKHTMGVGRTFLRTVEVDSLTEAMEQLSVEYAGHAEAWRDCEKDEWVVCVVVTTPWFLC